MSVLGVVIPTRWEASEVLSRFAFRKGPDGLWRAVIGRCSVILCLSGVGKAAAAAAADRLAAAGAQRLVSAGFCGALVPSLNVGETVRDRMATVDRPVRTPEERKTLADRANAVAVDMETQAVVEAGTRRGVPIDILRVVSDGAGDDLSPLFGGSGRFSATGIALRLLNPRVWPLAAKLKRQTQLARARLADELARHCA